MTSDIAAVEAVVWGYLEALYDGDAVGLENAFAPGSALYGVLNGQADILPLEPWLQRVAGRKSSRASGYPSTNRILSIDVTGEMALAKVTSSFPPKRFVDYLSLIRIGGGWKIIAKVYNVEDMVSPT